MSLREHTAAGRVLEERARWVARGVSTPRLVVDRAHGATHRGRRRQRVRRLRRRDRLPEHRARLRAGRRRDPRAGRPLPAPVLHGRDLRAVRRRLPAARRALAVRGRASRSRLLLNSGAEAVENAVKIARAATGRPAVVVFDNALPRADAADDDDDAASSSTGGASARSRRRSTACRRRTRIAASPPTTRSRRSSGSSPRGRSGDASPASCSSRCRARAASSSCPTDFPGRLAELCRRHGIVYVDDEVQSGVGRTGPVWAIEHYGVEPDLLVSGKSLGGGLPLAAVTGRAELLDAPAPGGLGGTFGGNPVACAAALAVLDAVEDAGFRARSDEVAARLRGSLERIAAGHPHVGEMRGLGPMLALELVEDLGTRAPAAGLAAEVVRRAFDRGLVLLSCGLDGERGPDPRPARRDRRGARPRARDPRGVAWRRCSSRVTPPPRPPRRSRSAAPAS